MHDFGFPVAQVFDGECDGPLHAVEVVVDAHAFEHEEGGCHAPQAQFGGKAGLEEVFYQADGLFGLLGIEQVPVVLGFDQVAHCVFSYCL